MAPPEHERQPLFRQGDVDATEVYPVIQMMRRVSDMFFQFILYS